MPVLQASKSYPGLEGCTYISYLDKVTTKCPVYIGNAQGAKVSEYFTFVLLMSMLQGSKTLSRPEGCTYNKES